MRIKYKMIVGMVLAIIAAGYVTITQAQLRDARSELSLARLETTTTTQLNDSLAAIVASTSLDKDSLSRALAAADELNADLVAAANIRMIPETVTVTRTLPTEIEPDSTRIASLVDSTASGVLDLRVVAPPFPAELEIVFTYSPHPVDVNVALLRLDDNTAIFAATWAGGTTEIATPFAKIPEPAPRTTWYVEGAYEILNGSFMGRVGATLRTFRGVYIFGEAQQIFAKGTLEPKYEYPSSLFVGLGKHFRLF